MRGGNTVYHSSVDNSEHHGTYSFTTKGIDGTTTGGPTPRLVMPRHEPIGW